MAWQKPKLGYYDPNGDPFQFIEATPEQIEQFKAPYYDPDTGQRMANPYVPQLGFERDKTQNVPLLTLPNGAVGGAVLDPVSGKTYVMAPDPTSPKGAWEYTIDPETGNVLDKKAFNPDEGGGYGDYFKVIAVFAAAALGATAINAAVGTGTMAAAEGVAAGSELGAGGAVTETATGGLSNLGIDTSLSGGTSLGEIGAGGAANGLNTVTGSGLGLNAATPSGLGFSASVPATAAFTGGTLANLPNIAATGAGGLADIVAGSTAVNAANGLTPAGMGFAPPEVTVPNIANPNPSVTGALPPPGELVPNDPTDVTPPPGGGPGGGTTPNGTTPNGTTPNGTTPKGFDPNLGGLLAALLGAAGANKQTEAYERIANRSWEAGAPSRGRYESSMTPGFSAMDIPGYKSAIDTGTESYLRKLSMTGNPANRGGAMGETLAYVNGTIGLPAIQNYQSLNANTGGLASLSGNAQKDAQNAIAAQGGVYSQLGSGLQSLFPQQNKTPSTLAELAQLFSNLKFS